MDLVCRMKHVFNFVTVMKVDETEKHVFYLVKVEVDTQIKYILTFDIDKLTKKADYFTTSVVFYFYFTVNKLVILFTYLKYHNNSFY